MPRAHSFGPGDRLRSVPRDLPQVAPGPHALPTAGKQCTSARKTRARVQHLSSYQIGQAPRLIVVDAARSDSKDPSLLHTPLTHRTHRATPLLLATWL